MAEREGFEPSVPFKGHTDFPGLLLKPLEHLSFVSARRIFDFLYFYLRNYDDSSLLPHLLALRFSFYRKPSLSFNLEYTLPLTAKNYILLSLISPHIICVLLKPYSLELITYFLSYHLFHGNL